METNNTISSSNTPSSPLAMHKNSQTISKSKPKIRIIHIFAPEIIKTDATNFRELVQRLTGKPPASDPINGAAAKKTRARKREGRVFSASSSKKMEMAMMAGFHAGFRERIKGEEEIWRSANSGGGFLGGFADQFDGFMQEINQFPLMEASSQNVDVSNGLMMSQLA
ncbi:hypothetical protein C2S53_007852 [Perilla frutescens var. hirtella]|uniref:VQ domain-containing protein n=1 Tax=Perilla frutescens var. hirtella TaxID=608512 RepID=A0AAD4J5F4_PERFH|nr:hypothetical protein C2S51_021848 [Perilla frutescens var. frutescens]KAH6827507.1 hypothetical protein C2S53_007852 [Perilla frutescens var. hirtella]